MHMQTLHESHWRIFIARRVQLLVATRCRPIGVYDRFGSVSYAKFDSDVHLA